MALWARQGEQQSLARLQVARDSPCGAPGVVRHLDEMIERKR